MSWLDDANAVLAEPDEEQAQPFDALSSDWRDRARALLAKPDPPKAAAPQPAKPDWRQRAQAFLDEQEQGPIGPEVDVVQAGGRANVSGQPLPSQAPPGATDIERSVIAGSPPAVARRGIPGSVGTPDAQKPLDELPRLFNEYAQQQLAAGQIESPEKPTMQAETPMMRVASSLRGARNTLGEWWNRLASPVPGAVAAGQAISQPIEQAGLTAGPPADASAAAGLTPIATATGAVSGATQAVAKGATWINLGFGAAGKIVGTIAPVMVKLVQDVNVLRNAARMARTAEEAAAVSEQLAGTMDRLAKLEALSTAIQAGQGLASVGLTAEGAHALITAPTFGEKAQGLAEMAGGMAGMAHSAGALRQPMAATRGVMSALNGPPPPEGFESARNVTPRPPPPLGLPEGIPPGEAPRGQVPVTPKAPPPVPVPQAAKPAVSPEALIEDIKGQLEELQQEKPNAVPEQGTDAGGILGRPRPRDEEPREPVGQGNAEPEAPARPQVETPSAPAAPPENIADVDDSEIVRRIKEKRAQRRAENFTLTPTGEHEPQPEAEPAPEPTLAEREAAGQKRLPLEDQVAAPPAEKPPAPVTPKGEGISDVQKQPAGGNIDTQNIPEPVAAPTKSYKVEVTDGSSYASNGLRFATPEEANSYGRDLMSRWMGAKDFRVAESDEPVAHAWDPQEGVVYLDRKPKAPVTPKSEEPTALPEHHVTGSLAGFVYRGLSKPGVIEKVVQAGDSAAVRRAAAAAVGVTPQQLVEKSREFEDALEAVLADRLAKSHNAATPLVKQIAAANEVEAMMPAAHRGIEKKALQQFSTPLPISVAAVHAARITPKDYVVEPTAGTGNLLAAVHPEAKRLAVEIDTHRADLLREQGHNVAHSNYLEYPFPPAKSSHGPTVIVTNPPWGKYTTGKYGVVPGGLGFVASDVAERFVAKNLRDLQTGGRLVAIMPTTMLDKGAVGFRSYLTNGQFAVRAVIQSPPKAYDTRGTTVDSVMLVVDKVPARQPFPATQKPANWSEYAQAVEAIHGRHTQEATRTPSGPEGAGKAEGQLPEPAKPGRNADVPEEPTDVVAGGRRAAPEPSRPAAPEEPAGDGGRAPRDTGGAPAGESDSGRPVTDREKAIARLKELAQKKSQAAAKNTKPSDGSGELGFGASATDEPDDEALLMMVQALRTYLADGITDFRKAILEFQKDFGDGWQVFKDELELAWDTLQGSVPGMDAARAVDDALNEAIRDRISRSPDWRPYERRTTIEGVEHPKVIIEAKQLAGVPYPELKYPAPKAFIRAAKEGWASVEQVEQALAALQANLSFTAERKQHGFLIADAVGVGKSRENALVVNAFQDYAIADKREQRLLIVTKNKQNVADLLENFPYVATGRTADGVDLNTGERSSEKGSVPYEIVDLRDWKDSARAPSHKDYKPLPKFKNAVYITDSYNLRRYYLSLAQLGLHGIVGDEAHSFKNVWGSAGGRAWQGLHAQIFKDIPRAEQRFLYSTATPAQDVAGYEYLYGLRLWPIDGFGDWLSLITGQLDKKGAKEVMDDADKGIKDPAKFTPPTVAAPTVGQAIQAGIAKSNSGDSALRALTPAEMEQIPREFKMLGRMSARDLWREGTEFEIHRGKLSDSHRDRRDGFSLLARDILDAVREFGKQNKIGGLDSLMRASSMLQFAAKRIALEPAMEEAIKVAQEHVAKGFQPVIRVLNVGSVGDVRDENADEGIVDEEPIDVPLHGHLAAAVNSINTRDISQDDNGNISDNGDIPEAIRVKGELMERARAFALRSPIDMLEAAFGKDKFAIKIGGMNKAMQATQKEFQQGRRPVMLISAAGATGINLDHRVLTTPPKGHVGPWAGGRRVFINAQFDWSATEELQAIGRVDRASSITPPLIKPITFGNAAENRFLAVVANRMASLGATSRGGAQATGSAKGLEEFEISGSDTMAAIRDTWRDLPDNIKDTFWGSKYRDPNTRGMTSVATLPDSVSVEDIQRALLYVPIRYANDFWKKVLDRRDHIREVMGGGEDVRTRAFSGEVLQQSKLTDLLTVYKLKNVEGHRFGLLVGVIMPEMPRIAPMLQLTPAGTPRRAYISFQADDGRTLTGLEIMWTRVARVAAEFGKDFGAEVLDTADKVREALRGGERVPLVQRNSKNGKRWQLRQSQGHIRIDNAGWAEQELLKNNGAWFRDVGQFWYVKPDQFERFIERFPAEHPAILATERAAEGDNPDKQGGAQGYSGGKPTLPPPPAVKPSAPVNAKQQRPSEVIKALTKALGIPARVGGYRANKGGGLVTWGIYKVKPEIIRTKLANDLPIFAHEVGHHLDKVYSFAVPRWRSELLPLGAPTSGNSFTQKQRLMEGVAEFVRLWMTDPLTAATRAPNFYQHFEATITGDIRVALKEAQQQIRGIVASDYVTRLKQKIDMVGGNVNADPRNFIQRVYERVFDDLGRIEEAVTEMGTPQHVLEDAHKLAVLARGSASVAHGFIEHGIKGIDGKFMTGSFEDALAPVKGRVDDFVAYLVALRARELSARGKETGFTREEIAATIKAFKGEKGFAEARDKLYEFQDALLVYLHQHGILDTESLRAMKRVGEFYVPFQRVMDGYTRELAAGRSGRQLANRRSPLKFFRGSARDVINPLESIIRNVYAAVDVAMQNRAMVALVKQADKTEGSGKWLDRIPTQMAATVFILVRLEKDIRKVLDDNGVALPADIDFDKVVRVWMPQSFADGNRGYITVLRGGKRYFYSINDKPLYDALTAIGPKVVHPALQLFVPAASLLRATATALNVTFGTRNIVRDSYVAWVQSDYGFRLGYDSIRGLYRGILGAARGDEAYKQFMTEGVMQAAIVGNDRRRLQADLRRMTGEKARTFFMRMRDTAQTPTDFLQAYTEWSELATRYGAFLRKEEGQHRIGIPAPEARARATWASRRSTVDFSVGGSWVRFMNTFVAFLNARTQGWKRAAESAKANPAGFALKATLGISALSAALWWWNKDDDRYDAIPAWEKNTFWHLPAPYTDSGFVRFPKPFELGLIFGTSVEVALDALYKEDPEAVVERLTQAFGGNGRVNGPVGLLTEIVMQLLPTAVMPGVEVASNYDRFRDRYIVQPWDEGIEDDLKYTRWTSDTAKLLAGYLHMAPVQLEHLIYGYTGGFGRGVLQTSDAIGYYAGISKGRPALAAARLPLLSAFYREGLDESAAPIAEMYRLQAKAQSTTRSINLYESKGEQDKADALEKKSADLLDRASELNAGVAAMKDSRADLDRIFGDATLTPQQKRDQLNEVYVDMVNTALDALGKEPLQATRPSAMERLRGRR